MKISSTSEPLRPDRVSPSNQDARAKASRPAEPVAEGEKVQVSELASRLNQLESQFSQADFDVKKVEEVRAAIAEGRFKVNAEAVADKLLASVADLLGAKR
ncbi:MAG: flagellar biosynthesis anti-sigma factor FlgM [Burkholderiaceae bacterium]